MPNNAKATSIRCAGKIVHSNVLGARATTLDAGARTITGQDADAIGATAASFLRHEGGQSLGLTVR